MFKKQSLVKSINNEGKKMLNNISIGEARGSSHSPRYTAGSIQELEAGSGMNEPVSSEKPL